jgi:hypothetical protein
MNQIADSNGVDVIIGPVSGADGLQLNIDYNFPEKYFHDLDHVSRDWDLRLMDGRRHIGSAKFSSYQFMADGLVRRTIALKNLTIEPRHRGQKKTYDLMKFVIDTVTREGDRDWGQAYGAPVVFIEKKDFMHMPENERTGLFDFLKRIAEKVIGGESHKQPNGGDLAVSIVGDQISMQLIQGHLVRSNGKS